MHPIRNILKEHFPLVVDMFAQVTYKFFVAANMDTETNTLGISDFLNDVKAYFFIPEFDKFRKSESHNSCLQLCIKKLYHELN